MEDTTENYNELKGKSGWLLLIGLSVVLSPIRLSYQLYSTFMPLFTDGAWEALTTIGSEVYNPLWGPMIVGEVIFNILIIIVSLYMIYLYFTDHYLFPKVCIGMLLVSLFFIPLDAWLVSFLMPDEPMFDTETLQELGRALFGSIIWIPYMLKSERVRLTFVENRPVNTKHQEPESG